MIIKEHRIQMLVLFSTSVLCILLMAISFWNQGLNADIIFGIWPIIFLILSLISISGFLILHLKVSNPKKLNAVIQEKVTEERSKLLAEFEKNKETVTEEKEETNIEVEKIIPGGNIKTEESFAKKLLSNLSKYAQLSIGIYYHFDSKSKKYQFLTGYALPEKIKPESFKAGENLNGQVAESKQIMNLKNIPENYLEIESGTGKSKPGNIIIAPIVENNRTIAILEIATFIETDVKFEKTMQKICVMAAKKLKQIQKTQE